MITKYHAKYYANLLAGQTIGGNIDSLSKSLLNAAVDINPHQIEAALFAFTPPCQRVLSLPMKWAWEKRSNENSQ